MPAETVTVELGSRSYPVRIGAGLRREALDTAAQRVARGHKCAAITSPASDPTTVAPITRPRRITSLAKRSASPKACARSL